MPLYENPLRETPRTFRPLGITGFASPAELWRERSLRLDDLLLLHPTTTYFIRAADHALRNLGIEKGDLVIIDRTLDVESGAIVLATLRGAFLLRAQRLHQPRAKPPCWCAPSCHTARKPTASNKCSAKQEAS